ncbi:MAG: GNAT family N-acetyltransferase [Bacteroidota bacterium]|nr:GNAT family N-acetyltransferase [Bacteroidota bacterium]
MTEKEVTTFYLEMTGTEKFKPKAGFEKAMHIQEIENDAFINFMLFAGVGLPWKWYSRLAWTPDDWKKYFNKNVCKTFLGFRNKQLIGYFELEIQENKNVEIKFFGLLPQFIGSGIGGYFLSHAINSAWQLGAKRIWLHTCSSDNENATANYISRGFEIFKEEKEIEEIPDKQELLDRINAFFSDYIG